ncbi:peptidoglycan-binding domain-containing protein [Trueperella pyogenes]|uniref:peptidoglycan-binding protein n=1 Tax=Trueperella pyogenes TaxID=1661 RepID=UPI00345CE9ED
MRRMIMFTAAVVVAALIGLGAGYVFFKDGTKVPSETPPATVTVETGNVGRSLNYAASVAMDSRALATNVLAGVVTFVSSDTTFSSGQTLYEVGKIPVVVVEGRVPFYRELSRGMKGADVKQLNAFLGVLGFPGAVDDTFGPRTELNVRQWQKNTGQPETGKVPLGQLVASPSLPAHLTFDLKILHTGALLAGGEALVSVPSGEPRVFLALNESQQALLPAGAKVQLTSGEQKWSGEVGESRKNEQSFTYEVDIRGVGGGALCTDDCAGIVPGTDLQATIDVVPQVSGPLVPRSAIMTGAVGTTYVIDASGLRHDVKILGASQGVVVVEGIDAGSQIRVFGEDR